MYSRFKEGIINGHIIDREGNNFLIIESNGKAERYQITKEQLKNVLTRNNMGKDDDISSCKVLFDGECIAILPKGSSIEWIPEVYGKNGEPIQPWYMIINER